MRRTLPTLLCLAASAASAGEAKLFDGQTLEGWRGDERFWSVEDGAIVGRTTKDNPAENNTFLVYTAGEFDDFVLTFDFKVTGFNSGVQYRSVAGDGHTAKGYQADFEAEWHEGDVDKFTGMFFEEGGRMFLGQRGQAVLVEAGNGDDAKPAITEVGSVGDAAELGKVIKRDDWNRYTVVASGNAFIHSVNGRVMSVGVDADPEKMRKSGVIAFQLHSGRPMEIRVKGITVKDLP